MRWRVRAARERWTERAAMAVVRWLPARVRVWTVVDAFAKASDPRTGGPLRDGYAGPDGLTYADAHAGASLTRRELRARARRRETHRST
jgi:hypothetical protein